jgi:hypothetical protein
MPTLPGASTRVVDTAGASASGLDNLCLFMPARSNADMVPRLFGSASAMFDQHGFTDGVDYASLHFAKCRKPIIACGLPIDTEGTVGRKDTSGNSGSSVVTVTASPGGCMGEHDGELTVVRGGTVGTSQIVLGLSLDGGRNVKKIRVGTGNSYEEPLFNLAIGLGAGTLVEGDTVITWHGTSPLSAAADWQTARENLAAQSKYFRSILLVGDLADDTDAGLFNAELEAYETANERFVYGRATVYDRLPLAALSDVAVRMTGAPSLTFAEVGASGDTITRATGSWLADGFVVGDTIVITGATASAGANNITAVIASLSATVITLGTEDLTAEVTAAASIVGYPTLTFAEVGASGDTITRNRGSWLDDGFRAGDLITIAGTASNNITAAQGLATVTATVLTLGTDDLVAEVKNTHAITLTAGQTKAAWMAELEADFEDVDDAMRISLSAGRGRPDLLPYSGWVLRRPAAWAASIREYQHDVHIATWRKDDGPVNFDLADEDGNTVEWDDRVDGEAGTQARFTTLRTWANGPNGSFIALDCTRASESSLLLLTSNVSVVNVACTITQAATEKVIGRSLVLNPDGTASASALAEIAAEVNAALSQGLLKNATGEGQRASLATWTPSADDVLNVPEATLTGVLDLELNGIVHSVNTTVRVRSGGQ